MGEGDRRNGSVINSNGYSCRRPGFKSQHSHGTSPWSIIPVPGYLMPFSGLQEHCRDIHAADKTFMHFKYPLSLACKLLSLLIIKAHTCTYQRINLK